ncbi:MAG: peptide-methionine (S)-S-oxide reductase MsrA [Aureliella sp.]
MLAKTRTPILMFLALCPLSMWLTGCIGQSESTTLAPTSSADQSDLEVLASALTSDTPEKVNMTSSDANSLEGTKSGETDMQVITLGGGCFWCVEAVFEEMEGVSAAISGYAGGAVDNPSYEAVCTGNTGHAEVCEIHFDASKAELGELLEVFFKTHDPTTLNRQGADRGTQYRSTIMYHNEEQKELAEEYIKKLDASGAYANKIVTEVVPAPKFFKAEEYHQDYFAKNPGAGYCVAVVAPKVLKFRDIFPEKRKTSE